VQSCDSSNPGEGPYDLFEINATSLNVSIIGESLVETNSRATLLTVILPPVFILASEDYVFYGSAQSNRIFRISPSPTSIIATTTTPTAKQQDLSTLIRNNSTKLSPLFLIMVIIMVATM
jgi:hypothetical protein